MVLRVVCHYMLVLALMFTVGCRGEEHGQDGEGGAGGAEVILTGVGGGEGGGLAIDRCPPGEERGCWCDQGYSSVQVCDDDGETLGPCDCHLECVTDANCHGSICEPAVCANGTCVRSSLPDGTMIPTAPNGDCESRVCMTDTAGNKMLGYTDDPSDVPNDDNPCTVDTCQAWGGSHAPATSGTPCPGGTCDGCGACKVF
jgi:hypothetical protein